MCEEEQVYGNNTKSCERIRVADVRRGRKKAIIG